MQHKYVKWNTVLGAVLLTFAAGAANADRIPAAWLARNVFGW